MRYSSSLLILGLLLITACAGAAPPEVAPAAAPAEAAMAHAATEAAPDDGAGWTCPMHPEVYSVEHGRCPKCNMFLVRASSESAAEHETGTHAGSPDTGGEHQEAGAADGGHMAHMDEVRAMLKEKLGGTYEEALPKATAEDLTEGARLYQSTCSMCHGAEGKGDGAAAAGLASPPADFTDGAHATYYSPQGRLWIIRNGSPGTPMVGWLPTLGEKGTLQVLAYVQSLASPDSAPAHGASEPHGAPGHHD